MSVVETLEVRFRANTAALSAGISAAIAKLTDMKSAASGACETGAGAIAAFAEASRDATKRQSALVSKLKGTARALDRVAESAARAADGIGLHKLDEVNLVGASASAGSASGSSSGTGSGGGSSGAKDAKEVLSDVQRGLLTLPELVQSVCKNLTAPFAAVYKKIDEMTGGLLGTIAKSVTGTAGNLGRTLWQRISTELKRGKATLSADGRSIAEAVSSAIRGSGAPTQAGSGLIGKVVTAIVTGAGRIRAAAQLAAASADFSNGSAQSAAYSAGANLSQGFANGISSRISAIRASVSNAVSAAVSKMRGILKIASPSKVTYALGEYFTEGFANGIRAAADTAERSAAALSLGASGAICGAASISDAGGMREAVLSAVREALGDTTITVPLSVDGMKLGEAAIRGINRVTRSAGRVMLDI